MAAGTAEEYLAVVEDRLHERGYRWLDEVELETGTLRAAASHKRFQPSRFGMSETHFAFVETTSASEDDIAMIGEAAFEYSQRNKLTWLPRGLGRAVAAYAVVVADVVVPEVARPVERTEVVPKHWASVVFPVLVDLSLGNLHYRRTTPMWGSAYFRGFRRTAERLLAPE